MSPSELAHLAVVIDLNEASVDELTSLHGVGPVVAARIDAARPFRAIDDLLQVRGIGPVTLQRNRARLRLTPP
jgi:competence protein ComEA